MSIKSIIEEIESAVSDVINTEFNHYITKKVPNSEDPVLTFERGVEKKGKVIETCILFADIRNSVALTQKHRNQTMGRIYTAFTKAVIKAAHYHGGFVRNIIGDRVMVVFPAENCFTNAVDCAITINHISNYVINKKFSVDFKCGIGIDHGELRVIKVGVSKQGSERSENKGLVWVGYPANIASRLTDVANKSISQESYLVTWHRKNARSIIPPWGSLQLGSYLSRGLYNNSVSSYDPTASPYSLFPETIEMTPAEFARNIASYKEGELYMPSGNFKSFERKTRELIYKPILMTSSVYNGYKKENPNCDTITKKMWELINNDIDNVKEKVYQGQVTWDVK